MSAEGFLRLIAASPRERADLFLATAQRLGTPVGNVEKDFWVSWILDALFNRLPADAPRLLFKGGTSLSKAYGLVERFSEDVDITVFRNDLGEPASPDELEALSGKQRQRRLDAIKASCQAYINGPLRRALEQLIAETLRAAGLPGVLSSAEADRPRLDPDESDPDRQTLLFSYPSVLASAGEPEPYVRSAVKIEAGAKSAIDPHHAVVITPYVAPEVPALDLRVPNVLTVDPERTFWDKLVILHGLRAWFERRGVLRQGGHRVSRHYYDVSRLALSEVARRALDDRALAIDCARHARLFFSSADLDLPHAVPGTLAIAPTEAMLDPLRRDYAAMAGMIFGEVPPFEAVVAAVRELERRVNA